MKKRKGTLALHISIVVSAGPPKRTCSHCQQSGQTVGAKASVSVGRIFASTVY
jgi:hypothetical protein